MEIELWDIIEYDGNMTWKVADFMEEQNLTIEAVKYLVKTYPRLYQVHKQGVI